MQQERAISAIRMAFHSYRYRPRATRQHACLCPKTQADLGPQASNTSTPSKLRPSRNWCYSLRCRHVFPSPLCTRNARTVCRPHPSRHSTLHTQANCANAHRLRGGPPHPERETIGLSMTANTVFTHTAGAGRIAPPWPAQEPSSPALPKCPPPAVRYVYTTSCAPPS